MSVLPERRYRWPDAAVSYRWRDPDHLTAAQLQALAARDQPAPPPAPAREPPAPWVSKREKFDTARAAGKSFAEAMAEAGCSLRSAHKYEHDRLRREAPGT